MKLWQKENTSISEIVEKFTVGNDRVFDTMLARYDVQGSMAHIKMLNSVGLLSCKELEILTKALQEILAEIETGNFTVTNEFEDVHSQIEFLLTEKTGDAGKKIHSGRSRNDQVAVAIKLFLKAEIKNIKSLTLQLFEILINKSNTYKNALMPGYTHMQIAMPSSFGLWFGAFAESLTDDMDMLATAYRMADKNPLGSGAGYGSSFPLDRSETTQLLGFSGLHYNSIYAQMSRGKTEKTVSFALSAVAATLSKLSMDVCLYNGQNFDFFKLPEEFTTGSSIMPHKKNPDVFELVRGKCNRIQAVPNELTLLINNLPAGYHREMQLTKEILFPAIESLKECLQMVTLMLDKIQVNENILSNELYKNIFTVEKLNELVVNGIPFREAYKQVGDAVNNGTFTYELSQLHHTHTGSIGNLCNDKIEERMKKVAEF